MALEGSGRLLKVKSSRTLIYVSQKVAGDSAFPFAAGDELVIRIRAKGLMIQKAERATKKARS